MGKPRLIILIRHAQSEGNKNKAIHQTVPDHQVPLTPEGREQALKCGQSLRSLLRPTDTIHIFTSPYRRTRETTEGILDSLTSNEPGPSPFPRHTIKVYEEPRLREQDFGNFQPGGEEMAKMWQQRADYGHFFYRIPNGESAADAYDRISGFNDSLWRRFDEDGFASVCILVTHGLMTRVFLMKWYHFSVEYFEDLRNVGHCEMTVLKRSDNGKFILQNHLRTWSELKRERAARGSISGGAENIPTRRRWGGCHNNCNDPEHDHSPPAVKRMPVRQNTADLFKDDNELIGVSPINFVPTASRLATQQNALDHAQPRDRESSTIVRDFSPEAVSEKLSAQSPEGSSSSPKQGRDVRDRPQNYGGRDGGGSKSGAASPFSSSEEDADPAQPLQPLQPQNFAAHPSPLKITSSANKALARALRGDFGDPFSPGRAMADSLGDHSDAEVEEPEVEMRDKETEKQEMATILEEERRDRSISGGVF